MEICCSMFSFRFFFFFINFCCFRKRVLFLSLFLFFFQVHLTSSLFHTLLLIVFLFFPLYFAIVVWIRNFCTHSFVPAKTEWSIVLLVCDCLVVVVVVIFCDIKQRLEIWHKHIKSQHAHTYKIDAKFMGSTFYCNHWTVPRFL